MKKAVAMLVVAAFAATAADSSPEDWYSPDGGWSGGGTGMASIFNADGTSDDYLIGTDGKSESLEKKINELSAEGAKDIAAAYQALYEALQAQVMVKNMAERLDRLMKTEGIKVTPANGPAYTVTFPGGIGRGLEDGGGMIDGESDNGQGLDGLSLDWNGSGLTRKAQIRGWNEGESFQETLAEAMTAEDGSLLSDAKVLVRNPSKGLNYVPIGKLEGIGIPPDNISIVTNRSEKGAYFDDRLSIAGARDAEDGWVLYKYRPDDDHDGVPAWSEPGELWNGTSIRWWRDEGYGMFRADLAGWTNTAPYETDVDIGALLTDDEWKAEREKYLVVARYQNEGESPLLRYLPFGDTIGGIVWATNWTKAVEFITETQAFQVVTFVTNSVAHENFITNTFNHEFFITNFVESYTAVTSEVLRVEDIITFETNMVYHEDFITNTFNHEIFITNFIESFDRVDNWTYVTNYVIRYMGGISPGSGEEGEVPPLAVEPADDPYSAAYEPQPMDGVLLPVKNARMMVAVTNEPLSAIESKHLLDFESVNTNDDLLVQVAGFDKADEDHVPVKKRGAEEGKYKLEWMPYPEDLFAISTNGISEVVNWMVENDVTNILKTVVSNADTLVGISTNLFGHVQAETALDDETIWTNGSGRVEIKGFKTAPMYTVPFIDYNQEIAEQGKDRGMTWQRLPFADSDLSRFGVSTPKKTIEAEEVTSPNNDQPFQTFTLFGFEEADDGSVPVKKTDSSHVSYLSWETPVGALKFVGNRPEDASENARTVIVGEASVTNEIVFASADDSDVGVECEPITKSGKVVGVMIKVGVYWK